MAGSPDAAGGDPGGGAAEGGSPAPEARDEGLCARNDGGSREERPGEKRRPDPRVSSVAGAKYKSMSPARLPIARAPCLTIPPGFSPSALLESPVLLTNVKAESSPTTGTLNVSCIINKTARLDTLSSARDNPNINAYDGGSSGDFVFKPHLKASYSSGLSSLGPLPSAGPRDKHESSIQVQSQSQAQKVVLSAHDLSLSVIASNQAIERSNLKASLLTGSASDELQQAKVSEKSTQIVQSDPSESIPSSIAEKSVEDGYNWRKYGQKHVKGSEHPRSYYKCTHPNCQMKKQLERSQDGQITEVIYKGHHDHPKPQSTRRLAVGTMPSSQQEEKLDSFSSVMSAEDKLLDAPSNQVDLQGINELSPFSASDDDVDVGGGQSNNGDEIADDDPESKRRKTDVASYDATPIGKAVREPRVVVQTISEVDILDDGYRWRKYGQKVVKGNPNPRSYYKCTNTGCPVRKHVERASHDPKAVITTYEGKHNHDVPATKTANHEASPPMIIDVAGALTSNMPSALNGMMIACNKRTISDQYAELDEKGAISLDLGVGICQEQISTANEQKSPGTDQILWPQMQSAASDSNEVVIQTTASSNLYGGSRHSIYGSREHKGEGFTFRTTPINRSSSLYTSSIGNLVMGP